MLDIQKILTISTSHIKPETSFKLANNHKTSEIPVTVYSKGDFGWFIYFSKNPAKNPAKIPAKNPAKNPAKSPAKNPDIKNIPEDLALCINIAIENGCSVLCLDCDGQIIENMPTYFAKI